MDIKPPPKRKKPLPRSKPVAQSTVPQEPSFESTPLSHPRASAWTRRQWVTFGLVGLAVLITASSVSAAVWYRWALQPRSSDAAQVRVVVEPGETVTSISDALHDSELIRSRLAFHIYVQLSGLRTKLQAGGYVLSPNQDIPSIVEHLTTGKTDEFDITIPPGLTLKELRERFLADGFTSDEVDAAFNSPYTAHPLLTGRPAGAGLEGYIYPETYRMNADQPLSALLERSFDELYQELQTKGLLAEFAQRGLSLHEAVTMASIIQKEVAAVSDQAQVAQVFHKRLKEGIFLQSDPTFIYAARQKGVQPRVDLESPYNTYRHPGLPPGPIANFNFSAIEAVARPAAGDFLYFVADQEGTTHFSRTLKEHEAKVNRYCTEHCNDF